MSKLSIEQKNVGDLFTDKKNDFLIPDYQRPYAWGEKECQTLWDDIFTFAFPENDCDKFDSNNDEYFLGPIVTFKNEQNQKEIIDGQQRLTTLLLLLRAFYERYGNMKNERAIKTGEKIAACIWKTNEFGDPDKTALKITSEVATDNEKEEFLTILKTGDAKDKKSRYAANYRFFQEKIKDFLDNYPDFFSYLPIRILQNCTLLPIEAGSQDTALRIFSTLNDRGKPLSDADIFKAQFYKFYSKLGKKDLFIEKWKKLETKCNEIFHPIQGTPMDEIFTRYMYFERAKKGLKSSTTEALRKFYERDSYAILTSEETLENIIDLTDFWEDVENQDKDCFSDKTLKNLFVLNYAPNGMWTYIVSVYYMAHRDSEGLLEEEKFNAFLEKIIAFIWAYAVLHPGVNALRTPIFAAMVSIVEQQDVDFMEFRFDEKQADNAFRNFTFSNNRTITKSMLTWWAYAQAPQELLSLETVLEIEHIFARNRQEHERSLKTPKNLEVLGNKALLEKRINIRASDYRFCDKVKYYKGYKNKRDQLKEGTKIAELIELSEASDFTEQNIEQRNDAIITAFIAYLRNQGLLL